MTSTDWGAGRDLIRAVVEYAATPRAAPAFVTIQQEGRLVLSGWLPGASPRAQPPRDAGDAGRWEWPPAPTPARRPRQAPYAIGWSSLTEAELRVVRLVASGLTNPQIASRLYLSRHTVGTHLRHVLQKLDLHSRVDLTRVALQHDPALVDPAGTGRAAGRRRRAS